MKKWISFICVLFILTFSFQPIFASERTIELNSQYAYLYDPSTSLIYLDKDANKKMYPASMTKVLTVSLALEKIDDLKTKVTITNEDVAGLLSVGASVAGFNEGEKVTYEDLLYGALLPSGADACNALARLTYGNIKGMVDAMNEKVKKLGLKNSHFENVTGLHDDNHYTTAKDMALILNDALKDKDFNKIFESRKYIDSSGKREWLSSLERAKFLKNIDISHIDGAKSGYTDAAQLTLASTMTVNNHRFILVTGYAKGQRTQNHVIDANTVYQYLTDNYHKLTLYKKDEDIHTYFILKSFYGFESVKTYNEISIIVSKDIASKDVDISYEGKTVLEAPLQVNESVGNVIVKHKEKELYRFDVSFNETKESSMIAVILHYGFIALLGSLIILTIYKLIKRKAH